MNKLKGSLPFELGKLSKLEVLSIYNIEIEGKIPVSLYTMQSLKVMLLSGNRLNGELRSDIVKLKDLETLSLFDNELKGLIPKELEALKKLRELNIS